MALWGRDSRHPVERSADERYAAVREGRAVVQTVLAVTSTEAIDGAADRVVAARVLHAIARDRKMSLKGKMQALTESAEDFTKDTHATLDGIAEKIAAAKVRREAAAAKHHGYYDGIIKVVEDSVVVIDRLSNGPLSEDGEG